MKRLLVVLFCLVGILGMVGVAAPGVSRAAAPAAARFQQDGAEEAVRLAFAQAVGGDKASILGFLLYDVQVGWIQWSSDGSVALLFLEMKDPLSGEVIATEPGLSIATLAEGAAPAAAASWQVAVQSAPDFNDRLAALPPELLTEDIQMRFTVPEQTLTAQDALPIFTGYKLPWAAGLEKRLSGSIGHVLTYKSCAATCRYAYDWADGTMFPLLASKGGVVKSFRWGCANGDTACTNFVILEDQSTIPTTYQVYYHMAYNSLPARLRVPGAPVLQGEYIGDVDDTGASTGHHLHYHVYVSPNRSDWSWGYSVDFMYDEVAANSGHPRTCSEASSFPSYGTECMPGRDGRRGTADDDRYLSANMPAHPPSGTLTTPSNRQRISTQSITIGGTATDDIQVTRIQVLASWPGLGSQEPWKTIDNITPGPGGVYSKAVDLCAAGVPEGPFSLLVKVYDREGSQVVAAPGQIQLIKNFACGGLQVPPAPACAPGDNQVALYAEPDFQGGCKKFDARTLAYSTEELGAVGDNNASSIQVGANVAAVLLDLGDDVEGVIPDGRMETVTASDVSLADNLVGSDRVSGLKVLARSAPPDEPFLPIDSARLDGADLTDLDSVMLSWSGGAGATSFDVSLSGAGKTYTWTVTGKNSLSVGTLAPGAYTWTVMAKNSAGTNTSNPGSFTIVDAAALGGSARALPFTDDVEAGTGGWTATGLWRRAQVEVGGRGATQAWQYNNGSDYSAPTGPGLAWLAGDLTSPPLAIPAGGAFLRFKYFAGVEDEKPYWDQRRVQVVDALGQVTDLYQPADDKQSPDPFWLESPPISLASFAGKTVRVRFHFDGIDLHYNGGKGWMVDDITVDGRGPVAGCADGDQNRASSAVALAMDSAVTGATICPQGDVDYYTFTGQAGQILSMDVDAQVKGSLLDAQVFLLGSDGRSVIAENDDEVLGDRTDPLLSYTLRRSGTYYIKVKAWDYPGAGGTGYNYDLRLSTVPPNPPRSLNLIQPVDPRRVPAYPLIEATAEDFDGRPVAQIEFFWHGPNWVSGTWVKLGNVARDGNRWYVIVDPGPLGNIRGSALYVQAKNAGGAALGKVLWDLEPDETTPSSRLEALPAELLSTAIPLRWTAEDHQGDIARFEFEYQANTGGSWSAWTKWAYVAPPAARSAWFIGQPGASYRFRMWASDTSGNQEVRQQEPEAATRLATACRADSFESADNASTGAAALAAGQSQAHNFCQNDVDWLSFNLPAAGTSLLAVTPTGGGAGFSVALYNASRQKVAAYMSADLGMPVVQKLSGLSAGTYYLEIKPLVPALYGTDVGYRVFAGRAFVVNLGLVSKP